VLLHASITGDHGEKVPSQVSVPISVKVRITITTETGLACSSVSPVPDEGQGE